jgi:hypothetical protein
VPGDPSAGPTDDLDLDGAGDGAAPTPASPTAADQAALEAQLARTRKAALTKTIASGVLLPFTEALYSPRPP